jgi:ligand-binding sensor domain-containing protein
MNCIVSLHCCAVTGRNWLKRIGFLAGLFFIADLFCFSQSTGFLPFSKLEIKSGLPGVNVRKITKDKHGFMWFATQDGLSRFDGRSYVNLNSYKVDEKRKLLGADIYDVKPDITQNYLWALTSYGGLNKIELTTCNVVTKQPIKQNEKKDTSLWYKCFFETDKHLLIGTDEGIIIYFNKAKQATDTSFSISKRFGIKEHLDDILVDSRGNIWYIMTEGSILITNSNSSQRIDLIDAKKIDTRGLELYDYAVYENKLLLASNHGLKVIDMRSMKPIPPGSAAFPLSSSLDNIRLDCI